MLTKAKLRKKKNRKRSIVMGNYLRDNQTATVINHENFNALASIDQAILKYILRHNDSSMEFIQSLLIGIKIYLYLFLLKVVEEAEVETIKESSARMEQHSSTDDFQGKNH